MSIDEHDLVGEEGQWPFGGDAGIELPERAGGRVPGIREGLPVPLCHEPVESLKFRKRHDRLSPDRRHAGGRLRAEPERHGPDRSDIGCDLLSPPAVAARRGPGQNTVSIDKLDAEAVEFRLRRIFEAGRFEGLLRR